MTNYKDLAIQLVIVTAGVFIALFVDSLVRHRASKIATSRPFAMK